MLGVIVVCCYYFIVFVYFGYYGIVLSVVVGFLYENNEIFYILFIIFLDEDCELFISNK